MESVYCVIMAGGQGSRLWPISTPNMPKQFVDLMGVGQTMLQLTYARYKKLFSPSNFIVVTNKEYVNLVQEQLPELPMSNILAEPFRRNTAPCVAYATAFVKQKNPDATMFVTPCDHYVSDEVLFADSVRNAIEFVNNEVGAITTLGVLVNRPETAFGYIQRGKEVSGYKLLYKAKTFTEKPDADIAKVFYDCGEFCWNTGIFVWKVSTAQESIRKFLPNVQKQFDMLDKIPSVNWSSNDIQKVYNECDNVSIDFGILQRAENVYVQQTEAKWADLGSWRSMYEACPKDSGLNSIFSPEAAVANSRNNLVMLPAGKKCIIDGLDDFIVVDNGDMLLICPRKRGDSAWSYAADIKTSRK